MKVVVTGGSGQLGSLVLARLAAKPEVKRVVSLDLTPPTVPSPKLDWKIADLRDPGLDRHFEGADALMHFAFVVARRMPPDQRRAVNVEGSRRMFEYALRAGLGTVVYSSSISAYGHEPGRREPLREDSPRTRWDALPYAADKFEVEAFLDELEPKHPELRIVRLRPAILVGRRITHEIAGGLASRRLIEVSPNPLPLVWDEDVADAAIAALERDVRGAFNLAADEQKPSSELARAAGFRLLRLPRWLLTAAAPVLGRIADTDAAWFGAGDACFPASSERARRELGWQPVCPTSLEVLRHFDQVTPRRLDPRIAAYFRAVNLAGPPELPAEARRVELRIHLDLSGPRGGDVTWSIDHGKVHVSRGIPRPPDAALSLSPDTLLSLLTGKDDLTTARMAGRVRATGDPSAELAFASFVSAFRDSVRKPGLRGRVARRFERWFSRAPD